MSEPTRRVIIWNSVLTTLAVVVACAAQAAKPPPDAASSFQTQNDWIGGLLGSQQIWIWFLAAFVGGLALNLTPCVFPMIPVTLAFFSGQAPGRLGYTVWLGLLYVVGMSITYALLGTVAANTGALLGSWLQQPAVLIGIAGLVTALALSLFGAYELQPPRWLLQRFGRATTGSVGALGMGLGVGVIAAPCIGPFVLGLLLFVSQLANPWLGFWLLLTLGLGMGLPYVLLGVCANQMSTWPKAGPWLVWTKKGLGIMLLGLALYFVRPVIAPGLFRWASMVGLVSAGVYLGWLERSRLQRGWVWIRRVVGVSCVAGSLAFFPFPTSTTAAVNWEPYRPERLAQAARDGRPVIVDIFADWCLPCVELDHVTFHHPEVVKRLAGFIALRVDATRDIPPEAEELVNRYEVVGVPTVLVFDATGQERPELRVQGFVPPKDFLARLARVSPHGNIPSSSEGSRQ